MKSLLLLLFFICPLSFSVFAQADDSFILGKWTTERGKIIKIVKDGNQYKGTTIDGAPILRGLIYRKNSWLGTIQNRSGKLSARCVIVMQDENKIKITARKGILTKRFFWRRTQ